MTAKSRGRPRAVGPAFFYGAYPRDPCGAQVAFRLCRGKVPRPRRSADADFLVKPFGRVLVQGISPGPLRLLRKRAISTPSLLIRGVSPNPCGAQVAFRLCRGKVPRPRRCSDEHFLVKPFSGVLVRGISPGPCACCASAPSQPRHFVTAPFRGKPARQAFAGRLRCFDVCDISLTLRRAACAAPPGIAFRLCRGKVPRPHRSADADSLVEPFGGVLVRGLRQAFAGRLRCFVVSDSSLTLRRAACAAPPGVAFRLCIAKSRDRASALMSTS